MVDQAQLHPRASRNLDATTAPGSVPPGAMHRIWRILLVLALVGAAAYGPAQLEAAAGNDDLARVRSERQTLVEANAALREQIRLLEAEVTALHGDPNELARIAREDLHLVLPGEVVFEIAEENP